MLKLKVTCFEIGWTYRPFNGRKSEDHLGIYLLHDQPPI